MNAYERLSDAIAKVPDRVRKMRRAASQINDAPDFEHLLDTLEQFVHIHGNEPDAGLANEFTALKSQLAQFDIDPDAHDEGMLERWESLDSARGNLYLALDTVLAAARDVGIVPDKPEHRLPDAEMISRGGAGLPALSARLHAIEEMLRDRIVPEGIPGEGRVVAQLVQVNQYVRIMRRNITLFGLTLSTGDRIDLSALERVVATMGRLTRDFHASVTSAVSRATVALREAAGAARKPVGRLARGLGVVVKVAIRREHAVERNDPPADFDLQEVHAMILRDEEPPESWRPWIFDLNFNAEFVRSLTPFANLTALRSLAIAGSLSDELSSVDALSSLTALEELRISSAEISDISALAALVRLKSLNLWQTRVRDVTPLANLLELESLVLWNTDVTDIAPLSDLTELRLLDLWGTSVRDLKPLARLTKMQSLDLYGTKVSDLAPLAGMADLRSIDIRRTPISSLAPLAGLASLQRIFVESAERRKTLSENFPNPDIVQEK